MNYKRIRKNIKNYFDKTPKAVIDKQLRDAGFEFTNIEEKKESEGALEPQFVPLRKLQVRKENEASVAAFSSPINLLEMGLEGFPFQLLNSMEDKCDMGLAEMT